MQAVIYAVLLLSGQGSLNSYELSIDPAYLDSLYSQPLEDLQFPAVIETPAGPCSCLAGFRGGSSLQQPKKSWKFELLDPSLLNASHVLLDAQYRDLSLMRNGLALLLSRELGFPAPLTEHVELYVNDVYYGVYLQVERIDEFFYARNGLGYGPLFKSVDHLGRFAWQPCDTLGTTGFEAERGSTEYLPLLRSLIDRVNLRYPLSMNIGDFISNAAISLAIMDGDAITKNYYLHLTPEGIWRYYPWDRDASFGNAWNGEYQPEWVEETYIYSFTISPLLTTLLLESQYRTMFDGHLLQVAGIMASDLPATVDSIYLAIRESVYADSMKQGTNEGFDEAVGTLRGSMMERAAFLPGITGDYNTIEVESMTLPRWEFATGTTADTVTVAVRFDQAPYNAALSWWSVGSEVSTFMMTPTGPDHLEWSGAIAFPADIESMTFVTSCWVGTGTGYATTYYPYYSFPTSSQRRVCAPTARRSAHPAHDQDLSVLAPIRYTSFLWSIPVVNESPVTQDISFYGFQVGDPPARLFAPDGAFIPPWDTLYLTNNGELLDLMLPGANIFGDLVMDSPAGTEFRLLDPSWGSARVLTLGEEVQCGESNPSLILSEICFSGEGGDWIEIFNIGLRTVDISGDILIDGAQNSFTMPGRLIIDPDDCLVICESYDSFYSIYDRDIQAYEVPGFRLNGDRDGATLMRGGDLIFSVMYEGPEWPLNGDILSLISPLLQMQDPFSWESADLPGTPGEPNPGWPVIILEPLFEAFGPNPVLTSFSIEYVIPDAPGELLIYDISGRLVMQPQVLEGFEGSLSCELPPTLRPGVYFAVIRSRGATASRKFILLR